MGTFLWEGTRSLWDGSSHPGPAASLHKLDIYHHFHVSRWTASRWIAENEPHRLHNHSASDPNPHGWLRKLIREDLQKMKDILTDGFWYRILNWRQLATLAGISEVSYCIICQHMQDLNYHFCVACDRNWISSAICFNYDQTQITERRYDSQMKCILILNHRENSELSEDQMKDIALTVYRNEDSQMRII